MTMARAPQELTLTARHNTDNITGNFVNTNSKYNKPLMREGGDIGLIITLANKVILKRFLVQKVEYPHFLTNNFNLQKGNFV